MAKSSIDLFLDDFSNEKNNQEIKKRINSKNILKCFNWNIRNPSIRRAREQVIWLKSQPFDILILTETKNSKGCLFIERYFKARGYIVDFPKPTEKKYGSMVISKIPFNQSSFSKIFNSPRLISIQLTDNIINFEIVGVYVPNNKEKGKKQFLEKIIKLLKEKKNFKSFIFCGDFNTLEPNHIPYYSRFEHWEYDFYKELINLTLSDAFRIIKPNIIEHSWVGRTGDGYRYDHYFISKDIVPKIHNCYYDHEPRLQGLSDHSCMIIDMKIK